MTRLRFVVWLVLAWLAACGGPVDASPAPATAEVVVAPAGPHTVVVFATASLRAPFERLARRYEADHPGAKVDLQCDGGAQLFARLDGGERADVVAIGDSSLMSKFAAAVKLADHSATALARNRIAIAVAAGNGKQVRSLRDLGRPDVRTALGRRSSSIGRHGRWVLSRQQLAVEPQAEADTAEALAAMVAAGKVDAAIVYATTCRGVAGVEAVVVPEAENTPVLYSISAVRGAAEPRGAAAFRALALGEVGQAILRECGFLPVGDKGS